MGFKIGSGKECKETNGKQFIECMENRAFSIDDIFPFEKSSFNTIPYYADDTIGLVHSVKIDSGVISKNQASTLAIKLSQNISYFLVLADPKLQSTSNSLELVPRTIIILKENAGLVTFILKEIMFLLR